MTPGRADGEDRLIVYAGSEEIPTNANITVDDQTYTTTDPSAGFAVNGNGTAASVDADLRGVERDGPHLTATFDCTKSAKG